MTQIQVGPLKVKYMGGAQVDRNRQLPRDACSCRPFSHATSPANEHLSPG